MFYIVITDKLGGRTAQKAKSRKEAFFVLSTLKKNGAREASIFKEPFHSTTDEKALVAFFGKGSYWDNVSKERESVKFKRFIF